MSTSTIGQEDKKILLDAYMFERRTLFGCTIAVAISVIIWIVAIATDHWVIISGGSGIYIPENRRFFLSSHSGIWRICRYGSTPTPTLDPNILRNFTTLTYQNDIMINNIKAAIANDSYINEFANYEFKETITEISDPFRQKLFSHWIRNDTQKFQEMKQLFHELYLENHNRLPNHKKPIHVDPTNENSFRSIFNDTILKVQINGTEIHIAMPKALQYALFPGWQERPKVLQVALGYSRDLNISLPILNSEGTIQLLVPPSPPKGKKGYERGFEYTPFKRCSYMDMFPTDQTIRNDKTIDDEILDYIRTEASFAVISLIVMIMGVVFSVYTFLNPRYMFKRLAGGIHMLSGAAILVVIQVILAGVEYQHNNLAIAFPEGSVLILGYGLYLAWIVFVTNVIVGLLFLWYSGKKKGNKAATDELAMADETVNIGR